MILIVEDDPLARQALQTLLNSKGYPSRAVGSAEAALTTLDSIGVADAPALVLIDVDLPGMSGLDLLYELGRQYPDLPCTLMSGESQERVRQSQVLVPFLPKPLDTQRLLSIVADNGRGPTA